jgi:Putative S-adenosyl-L-methionine-dependent methyltransferase
VHLVEVSPKLRELQQKKLERFSHIPMEWNSNLSEIANDAPILAVAQEFFDALPVNIFLYKSICSIFLFGPFFAPCSLLARVFRARFFLARFFLARFFLARSLLASFLTTADYKGVEAWREVLVDWDATGPHYLRFVSARGMTGVSGAVSRFLPQIASHGDRVQLCLDGMDLLQSWLPPPLFTLIFYFYAFCYFMLFVIFLIYFSFP